MSHTHDLFCIDGCGTKLGSVTLPDGVPFLGSDHYGLMVPAHAETRIANQSQAAQDSEDARIKAAMDRLKLQEEAVAGQPDAAVLVDEDSNPVTPPVLKRVWNWIFKRS